MQMAGNMAILNKRYIANRAVLGCLFALKTCHFCPQAVSTHVRHLKVHPIITFFSWSIICNWRKTSLPYFIKGVVEPTLLKLALTQSLIRSSTQDDALLPRFTIFFHINGPSRVHPVRVSHRGA